MATTEKSSGVTAWTAFQKRSRELTGLNPQMTMKFCSFMKTRKSAELWTDAEIKETFTSWTESTEPVTAEKPKKPKKADDSNSAKPEKADDSNSAKPKKAEDSTSAKAKKPKKAEESKSAEPEKKEEPNSAEPSIASLEFHLTEEKKKAAAASAAADKEESNAKHAAEKAAQTMKLALEHKLIADKAALAATEARALADACQKEVVRRTEELEKSAVATVAPVEPSDEPLHLRRKKIPKHVKTLVWNKYIGTDIASADCVSCRTVKISNRSFHCGHVIAESKGGDMTINNLRPICDACNGSMGVRSMNEFTKEFFGWMV